MRRYRLLGAALMTMFVLLSPSAASSHHDCHTSECKTRVLSKKCSNNAPKTCVEWVIRRKKVSGWQASWLRRIPGCESGWNPYARNRSGATGLYQFMPGTWRTTPYGYLSITSARAQVRAAAWMLRQGRSGEWVCR